MPLWKRLWLLFTVIWVVVAALNVASILAFSEEPGKALMPIALGIAVPAAAYVLAWLWQRWRSRRERHD